ncbi:prepilin peptidase [Lacrimispora sp. NSJ-141]|uniref:Prepilin peptidase n=1 Tax=Lientehia hominis TaxID=2897778 RepID=A0AAP2W8G8_9FIRM|nr:prepilin peptidase [Lientehia hominis]MCD2493498.1 prepilin peptidase [Lientehia hominis]
MFLVIFLGACTYWDCRYRKIPILLLAAGIVLGTGIWMTREGLGWRTLLNVIPGVLLSLTAWLLPGQIGMGDGWMIAAAGAAYGWKESILLLEGGLLLMFPAAFFFVMIKRKKDHTLPFAPFMLGGYICQMLFF